MPKRVLTHVSTHTPEQLFDLVIDVEQYPEFLPWCRAARVLKQNDTEMEAELVISFKHWTESYVSKITLNKPHTIHVEMLRGPFKHLVNHWKLNKHKEGTEIDFMVDFEFRSNLLNKLIGALFTRATEKMVDAFETRADELYG
jgi:coenzyme Q-binding protein COQ10